MRQLRWIVPLLCATPALADDWPQWLGPKRDSVWNETGIVDSFPPEGPKVLWRSKVAGGFAGPSVAGGKVFVADYLSDVDPKTEVYDRTNFKGKERLHCLNAKTGESVWKYEYDCNYTVSFPSGPRCTPTVQDGKVYFLGAEGNLACLDVATGKPIWTKDFKKDYGAKTALWGYCSHPLVVGNKLFCVVGGEGSTAVAFDKDTGKELWKALTAEEQGYSAPTLIDAGGTKQLLIWHASSINGLDPETGKKYWAVPIAVDYKIAIMTPRLLGDTLYVGGEGGNGVAIRLAADKPEAKEIWRASKKAGLSPINMTPFLEDGHMYGVDQTGHLRCVELATGKRVWESADWCGGKVANAGTAFIVKNGDRFFLFTEQGFLAIAKLSPSGYEEISRAKILEPTLAAYGRSVLWTHPAFADGCCFIRNDKEIVCVSLKK